MTKPVHGGNIYKYKNEVIDFSANINPLGMPNAVKEAIIDNIDCYHQYPDPHNTELVLELGNYYNLNKDYFVCGNGAADIIFRITLSNKPKKALIVSPTFSEYENALNEIDCSVEHYLLKEENGFVFDINDFFGCINGDIDIVFICNPNNPTGIPIKKETMLSVAKLCKEKNIIIVVDECFCDFLINEDEITIVDYLENNNLNNVIILKAFTKIYAMAGIRLGYSICINHDINHKIKNSLQPWSVSTIAKKCGVAALKQKDFVKKTKEYVKDNREYLISNLKELGVKVYSSSANYLFFKCNIKTIIKHMEDKNILIRSCSNYISLDETYYRIAVRTKEENRKFINELKELIWQNR